jgi:hypothetical protein
LIAQSSVAAVPNPLPGINALATRGRTYISSTTYRPTNHWTFGAIANFNSAEVPFSPGGAAQPTLTNDTSTLSASAAYTRHVWKFDYAGALSGGVQSYSNASRENGSGRAKIYSITNGLSGGDVSSLRYGVRLSIDRADNPVFFSLLGSNNRMIDLDLASHRFPLMRLSATVGYREREVTYAGSTQHLNGLNFLVTGSRSNLDVSAGHTTSDTNERIFGLLSPLPGNGGSTLGSFLSLLAPRVFSSSTSDTITATWRARHNLRLNSQYTRFDFTVTGQSTRYRETWFDNSVQYTLGRFDIIGGFVRASGQIGVSNRLTNRFYFRLKFPFQVW